MIVLIKKASLMDHGRSIEYLAMLFSNPGEGNGGMPAAPEEFRELSRLHTLLFDEPFHFTEETPPDPTVEGLIGQAIESCLTPPLRDWLAACAVFPVLNWSVTIFLGRGLVDEGGRSLLTENRLLVLSQLPWFRQGWMPGWLRRRLISGMSEQRYLEIRALFESSLALDGSGAFDALPLRVAWERRGPEASRPSSSADTILLEFVLRQHGKGLDLHLVGRTLMAALRHPSGLTAGALFAAVEGLISEHRLANADAGLEAHEIAAHGGLRDRPGNEWMGMIDALCTSRSGAWDPSDWRAAILTSS